MYDLSADLQVFYDEYVRLGKELRDELAGYRDLNLSRVNAGLDELAKETGRPRPHPYGYKNQGGYAMHTLNKAVHDDYDIDVALLFRKSDLPDDSLAARQRVCEALLKKCVNFSKDPEVRTNAVTVWYPGHHIDFAIYRTSEDFWGNTLTEHASTEWNFCGSSGRLRAPDNPMYMAFTTCVLRTIRHCNPGVVMHFILDSHRNTDAWATICYSELKDSMSKEDHAGFRKVGDLTFADSKRALPLQAADLLAYEAYKYAIWADGDVSKKVRPSYALALRNFRSRDDFWLYDAGRFANLRKYVEMTTARSLNSDDE